MRDTVMSKNCLFDNLLFKLYQRMEKIQCKEKDAQWRQKCRCYESTKFYSNANVMNDRNRNAIQIGKNTHIRGELFAFGKNGKIAIGDESYLGENSYVWSVAGIWIGNRVLISNNCNIFDNDTHPKNSVARNKQFKAIVSVGQPIMDLRESPIVIEDDVWIATNCTILKGVTIGEKSIIGAGTVVTHDVPKNSVAFGNPMVIKENSSERNYNERDIIYV